jgi:hypothetical protein
METDGRGAIRRSPRDESHVDGGRKGAELASPTPLAASQRWVLALDTRRCRHQKPPASETEPVVSAVEIVAGH